eukprot:TRINITY_DN3091_c0_g1_i1.p1 TRINITY_DN3091_c0_g1~~TRINITY_DN3091_c0_g1_i1.p1  ORF type:complete len:292 (+),score=78.98 TRINITY_DN3091_c0_g1_i1:289-1164(+)
MHLIMSIAESRVDASAESREDLRRRHKRVVLALLLFAAMLSVAIASLSPEWADLCMMNATERAAATAQWFYAAPLFMVSEAIIVLCLATHVLAGQEDSSDPYTHAYLSLCTLVAYQAFAGLIVFLKHVLADSLCNTVPNSVSGHTHFYIFYALTLPRLAVEGHKPRCRKHTAFWFMCYTSLVMLCVFQSYRTLVYGFHTIRQIAYGAVVSLGGTAIWMYSIDADLCNSSSPPVLLHRMSAAAAIGTVLAVSAAGLQLISSSALVPASIALTAGAAVVYTRKCKHRGPVGLL